MEGLKIMFVHVDMDAFFVAVEELLNPALRGKPVAVGGSPDGRGVVASASYEARKFGVRSAMSSYQAKKVCPNLIFVPAHYDEYANYSDAVAAILERYSPQVDWVSIDEAYVNLYGFERLYGPAVSVGEKIRSAIQKELHLSASIGVARNRLMAKVASDYAKPHGLLFILPGHEESFLKPLPIRVLPGIGEKLEKELEEMGVSTIGDLAAMPVDLLQAVFGIYGLYLWKRAHGQDSDLHLPEVESKSISREITLEQDTVDEEYLSSVLHLLIEKAANELRKTHRKAKTITLKLRYTDLKRVSRAVTLDQATNLDEVIFKSAMELLQKNWQRRVRIRLIGIHLSQFEPETGQLELFPDPIEAKYRNLYEHVDQVRERFGFDSVRAGKSTLLRESSEHYTTESRRARS
jgi:DNA polymerase IV